MAVWVLEPKDTSREDVTRIVVVADSEEEARAIAARRFMVTHDNSTPARERDPDSPWRDRGATSCKQVEEFDDPVIAIEPPGMR